MRSVRAASAATLLGSALCLASCSSHHTADEEVLKRPAGDEDPSTADDTVHEEEEDDDDDDERVPRQDAGRAADAGRTTDAGMCAGVTDPIELFLCQAGLGSGGIDEVITGILGGGMGGMNCARETDPIALILCQAASGAGIDGLIDGLFGGGRDAGTARSDAGTGRSDAGAGRGDAGAGRSDAGVGSSDAGVDRAAFVQAVQRIIEELITALFGGNLPTRDAGLSQLRISAGEKSARVDDLVRTPEQCAEATQDDLMTRLICARQALATLSEEP
jgi:hypothetical protein